MKKQTLEQCIKEAERFIERAKKLQSVNTGTGNCFYWNPIEQGAVKRASMDLTRSLADLRQGR